MKKGLIPELLVGILCVILVIGGVRAFTKDSQEGKEPGAEATLTPEPEDDDKDDDKDDDRDDKDDDKKDDKEDTEAGGLLNQTTSSGSITDLEMMDKKADYIKKLIDNYYLYEVSEEDYEVALYRALLDACNDPYTCYYTPEEYAELEESSSGIYCGIGCLVSQNVNTMLITIVKPFAGSPAAKAGVKAGDIVTGVDGEDISGQDINLVVSKMKGLEDTEVTITVYRESVGEYLDFTMKRAYIEVETVTYEKMREGSHKLGLITVSEFEELTLKQFEEALEDLKDWGMEGLVIDLRDNPGGLLDTVTEMLDPLLPKGLSVYMQDKYGNRDEYKSDSKCYELPMVILINGNSASASEIFAGAMQDYEKATIVGTQSFGKGIVQSVIPLTDGSAVKMTIADYYTPLGRNIHGVGITPDVVVELPAGESASSVEREKDTQLKKAVELLLEEIR
ncbi:MAG: S41 family peptidase [Lachnospiraceae bacterium]|nr:S41 family peptidase [Lachnospiraceae bacterium]